MDKYRVVIINPKTGHKEAYHTQAEDYVDLQRGLDLLREGGYEILSADRVTEPERSGV